MSDTSLNSQHGKIMLAIRDRFRGFAMPDLPLAEVEVRESFINEVDDTPYQGITIQEKGEAQDRGVIGFHDVGFRCLVTIATSKRGDAALTNDLAIRWRERIRNNFQVQRLRVSEADGVRHHCCKIEDCKAPDLNTRDFPGYILRQFIIVVWDRIPFEHERTGRP